MCIWTFLNKQKYLIIKKEILITCYENDYTSMITSASEDTARSIKVKICNIQGTGNILKAIVVYLCKFLYWINKKKKMALIK